MVRPPRDLREEMLALDGTVEGEWVWCFPWRARNAIWAPEGREAIVMGAEGKPQGCERSQPNISRFFILNQSSFGWIHDTPNG